MSNESPRRGQNTAGADEGKVDQQKPTSPPENFQPNSPLDWALAYAAKGWRIFPLHSVSADGRCTCGQDCGKVAGKHPRLKGGFKIATSDTRQIEAWWRKWPDANIGIATGAVSGIVVVDVDGPDALARLHALAAQHNEPLPRTLTVKTARGWHFYFKHPHADLVIPCSTGDGIDLRGDGGYVVAPPSVHKSGHIYRWCNDVTA
jgi:putative DNA primase/helicase